MTSWVNSPVWWTYFIVLLIVFIIWIVVAVQKRSQMMMTHLHRPAYMGWGSGITIFGFILAAVIFVLFAVGCYRADWEFNNTTHQMIFRTLFGFIVAFLILYAIMVALCNLKGAFVCALFVFALTLGLMPYVTIYANVSSAWYIFPFFLWSVVLFSMTGRLMNENWEHPMVHNRLA